MTRFQLKEKKEAFVKVRELIEPIYFNAKNDFTTPDLKDKETIESFKKSNNYKEIKSKVKPRRRK